MNFLSGILFTNLTHSHPNVLLMSKEQVQEQAFKQGIKDSGAMESAELDGLCVSELDWFVLRRNRTQTTYVILVPPF